MSDGELNGVPDSGLEGVTSRKEFATALTALRTRAGLTVRQVAEGADTPGAHSTIGDWFAGRGLPSTSSRTLFVRVLRICGVSDPGMLRAWLEAWQRVRPLPGPAQAGKEPYRGLASFGTGDADWYFGRDEVVSQLVAAVGDLHVTGGGVQLVVGPSGAGKSSLLGAGLIPAVRAGAIAGSKRWQVKLFTPGAHPVAELAQQFANLLGTGQDEITTALRADPGGCAAYTRLVADRLAVAGNGAGRPRLLLVIDQFEELFAECKELDERNAFVEALFAAASQGDAIAVIALRADFYSHALRYPQLAGAAAAHQLPLGPMNQSELRQAIEKPARKARIDVEPGLAEVILQDLSPRNIRAADDAAYDAGALPLFSHALYATWRLGLGKRLTIAGYRQVGGVGGAIAATAEAVYGDLTGEQKALARRLLLSLIHVSRDAADTRRRVAYTDLDTGADSETLDEVLGRFITQRLISIDADTVQISHEALLTAWPRLRQWLDADRSGLVVSGQLAEAAHTWSREGRDASVLYRGMRLAVAHEWAKDHQPDLSPLVVDFLAASRRDERRRTHRAAQAIAALTVLAVAAAGLAVYAFGQRATASDQRQEAISQRNQAVSRLIALRANKLRNTDTALAMQLSLAAYRVAPTVEARSSLLDSSAMPATTRIRGFTAAAQAVAISPDKRMLAAGSVDGTVRLWEISDPRHPVPLGMPLTGPDLAVFSVAISPGGQMLAAGGGDGKVHRWDISAPTRPRALSPLTGPASIIYSIAFSPGGDLLAAGSADKKVRYWDLTDPSQPQTVATLSGPSGPVQVVSFSPDGRVLAAGSADATTRLWSLADVKQPAALGAPLTGPKLTVFSLAFSPDSRMLAIGSADSTTRLWDITHPAQPAPLGLSLSGPTSWINALAFSPDGGFLAAGSSDNAITVWETATGRTIDRLPHPSPVTGIAFGRDRNSLASSASDGTLRLWTLPRPATRGATNSIFGIAVSPDGRTMAEASRDQTLLWDITDRRHPTQLGQPISSPDSPLAGTTAFSPDGRTLAIGTRTGAIQLWDVSDRSRPRLTGAPLLGLTSVVQSAAFSPDGQLLAAGENDSTVRIWNVRNPQQPALATVLNDTGSVILFVAFSPDSKILAVAGSGNQVHLWDLSNPAQPARLAPPLSGPANDINTVAFSPDGRTLAAGSTDRSIHRWNLTDPRHPVTSGPPLTGPNAKVFWTAFSPDGKQLAAAVTDGTVWIWDTTTPQPTLYATVEAFGRSAYSLFFTPDSAVLAASGAEATTKLWDTNAERVAAWVCTTTGDLITADEWAQHVAGMDYQASC